MLEVRKSSLTAIQRIALVDAMAHWMGNTGDDELATALAELACGDRGMARDLIFLLTPLL
ncbi:hypothetical protein GCM10020369_00070 [Cryptosporangium minutisporangium]|uniref:Uncharacterized protein n=2 Tax=Cryptosporangium minutisporangium TaxID=113569 RepID=A0ABP6SPY6_9ACTN